MGSLDEAATAGVLGDVAILEVDVFEGEVSTGRDVHKATGRGAVKRGAGAGAADGDVNTVDQERGGEGDASAGGDVDHDRHDGWRRGR